MAEPDVKSTRRVLVKRIGAGMAMSSLPAQSVWGACNASGISGGSRVIAVTCEVPKINGGWSPGIWKKLAFPNLCALADDSPAKKQSGKKNKKNNDGSLADTSDTSSDEVPVGLQHALHAIVKIFGDNGIDRNLEYIVGVAQFIKNTTVSLGDGDTVEKVEFNLQNVLGKDVTGGSKMDLAAMYLNAFFGLSKWKPEINPTSDDIVEDFWGSHLVSRALANGTENRDGTPRFPMPDDLEIASEIVKQYWDDNSPSVRYGMTELIPVVTSDYKTDGQVDMTKLCTL
jgi:hypothetical protein